MKFKFGLFIFAVCCLFSFSALAQYNPAKDNPYVRPAGANSKKWYEFYKQERRSSYLTQNAGYWHSTQEDNALVKGVKYFSENIWEAAKALI